MAWPSQPPPSLAQRAWELRMFGLAGSSIELRSGRELLYRFTIYPSECSRLYQCLLRIKPGKESPDAFVISPNLKSLARDKPIPHIYPSTGTGTKLCLWWPKQGDWKPQMKLTETYIPWTAEWLWYFEDWLCTGEWAGGGAHPDMSRTKRKKH